MAPDTDTGTEGLDGGSSPRSTDQHSPGGGLLVEPLSEMRVAPITRLGPDSGDLTVLELVRVAPNRKRAREVSERLDAFEAVPMSADLWSRAREIQVLLSTKGDHRRVPPADLLFAAAEHAGVPLIHYDRDYERIASVTNLRHNWFVADGSLA